MPLVSVIIPAYNREQYLEVAVRSVLEQTIADIEILIIDDASTDTTPAIADSLAQEDSRIRVFHHEHNRYRSGALNTGLDNATGSYIGFLDSDDYYLHDKLERQAAFLKSHTESDGVYGDFEILWGHTDKTEAVRALASAETLRKKLIAKAKGELSDIMQDGYIPSCSVLIRASVFKDIRFDSNLRNMEDLDMWLQILGKGFVLTRLPGSTYIYRQHGEQKSSDPERMGIARAITEEKMRSGAYLN